MRVINLGVLAHVDAGKTTTVEQMLFLGGQVRAPGSVDKGNTQTDFLPVERQRGISVRTSSISFALGDTQINLIDTPGHMDFTGEVERALCALDAAILVVSTAEGIQSQTEVFWDALRKLGLPTLIFLNKIDRSTSQAEEVLAALRKEFSAALFLINQPQGQGEAECSVTARSFSEEDTLALCDISDGLAERYLAGETLRQAELHNALSAATESGRAFPLVFGAARLGIGIQDLMEAITGYLPSKEFSATGQPSGIIYKIEHDKAMGKVAHVRLFEGSLCSRDSVHLYRGNETFEGKIHQIRRVSGPKKDDTGLLLGGDIGALYGLSEAKTGDIIGHITERNKQWLSLAAPLFSVQVFAKDDNTQPLLDAVRELCDEDPLMAYEWTPETGELVLRIMGKVQLEILEFLLRDRFGMDATFSKPTVIYKETPAKTGIGFESYTMPKPCWAVVELLMEPMPRGHGFSFESRITHEHQLFTRYQNHIAQSVPEALKQGLYGWEVTDLHVSLIGGEHHLMHTHPLDFFLATPIATLRALTQCGSQLLEPMARLRLSAQEELAGKLIGDVIAMRGEFDSPVMKNGWVHLEALVPVATSMDYSVRFASLTSGRGILRTQFDGYKKCPLELGATTSRRGINPLDRAKWILFKRGALQ